MMEARVRLLPPIGRIGGSLTPPGDKSISHRSLLFAAIAEGRSRIEGLAPGGDARSTRRVLESLGVEIHEEGGGLVVVGRGWAALDRTEDRPPGELSLDCGNSGTTARLLCGLLAGRRGRFRIAGDPSLSRRPMGRVRAPLEELGACFEGGDSLPLTVVGSPLSGGPVAAPVPSAQVKSALILAALQADGESLIREPRPTRDHTERLLRAMGAPLAPDGESGCAWRVGGGAEPLRPLGIRVAGDPSSAAYAVALAALLEGSDVRVLGVCVNPRRLGFYRLLRRLGGDVRWHGGGPEDAGGEIRARARPLQGIDVGPEEVVDSIDEIPLLAVVAAAAEGETTIRGAEELRHKESDRISSTVALLEAFGADVQERPDGLRVRGGRRWPGGAQIDSRGDHRIAMCAAVAAALG
ncbi:MAG: 3-phosphoshikimate 1-carboxyvinyltransferase, partial [Planctomycetota bacterium]